MIKLHNSRLEDVLMPYSIHGADYRARQFNLIITSPPYNIGVEYDNYNDDLPIEEYLTKFEKQIDILRYFLSENGSLFLNFGSKPSKPELPFLIVNSVLKKGLKLQNTIHWIKSIAMPDKTHGHYKPINSDRFINDCHEFIFHFTHNKTVNLDRKAIGVPYSDKSNIERFGTGEDLHCRGNTWFIPYETRNKVKDHPATFPEELVRNLIKLHGGKELNIDKLEDKERENSRYTTEHDYTSELYWVEYLCSLYSFPLPKSFFDRLLGKC